jgi:hypothetical protein
MRLDKGILAVYVRLNIVRMSCGQTQLQRTVGLCDGRMGNHVIPKREMALTARTADSKGMNLMRPDSGRGSQMSWNL